ncbi:MAG: fused MFS/spermidine synthase [Deltaproteobacteria bacterium]
MASKKLPKQGKSKSGKRKSDPVNHSSLKSYHLFLLYGVCFVAGMFVMTLEMLGFRMLAPYFGYSIYVWGSLIGIIMLALSCGYIIGGSMADRYPHLFLLFGMIFLAGLLTAIISFFYRSILLFCQSMGLVSGSIAATILLFAGPLIFLSSVSPFLIRLLAKENKVGTTAGRIYSLSTVGSIFGTFLASFLLIPSLGSHKTLIITVIALVLVGAGGLAFSKMKFALLGLVLVPVVLNYPDPPYGKNTVYAGESPYSHIEVVKIGDGLCLRPQENFCHSFYLPGHIMTRAYLDYYCLGPLIIKDAKSALILGMGAGTSVRQFLHFWKDLQIDAVEIDPVIAQVATNMFSLPAHDDNLNVIIDDARAFLQTNPGKSYDIIEIDIFQGGVFIPFYLATQEFFSLCNKRLKPGGMLMMNVNILKNASERQAKGATLFGSIGNTISEVFPSVFYVKLMRGGNVMLLVFKEHMSLETLSGLIRNANARSRETRRILSYSLKEVKPYEKQKNSPILTDDLSPLDKLTYPIAQARFKSWLTNKQ